MEHCEHEVKGKGNQRKCKESEGMMSGCVSGQGE